ncbi:MAG: Flp pilus assembly complex ATPase component TadA [Planctomycetes bacterium]|nr:Flp pilus assembly complex ATPase component TadA [Planctomycetota bacterium]
MRTPGSTARFLGLATLAVAGMFLAREALGADPTGWPDYPLDPDRFRGFGNTLGGYLSIWKILGCWLVFLCWVYTTDWINQDSQIHRMGFNLWNPITVGTFAVAFLLVWVIPVFWFGMSLMVVAWLAPLITYIFYRNSKVEDHLKVLTPDHLKHWFASKLKVFGVKVAPEQVTAKAAAPSIQFSATAGATPQENEGQHLVARQLPGYEPAQRLMIDALDNRADAVLIDVGETTAIRYLIDGVWHNSAPQPGPMGDALQSVYKTMACLDAPSADLKVGGDFGVKRAAEAYVCRVTSQAAEGTKRLVLRVRSKKMTGPTSLEELGMRAKTIEQLNALVAQQKGMLLFSAPPAGGLTTIIDVILNKSDRFLRDFCSVEDAQRREHEITNVEVTTYDSAAGETPATVLPKLFRRKPNVLLVRELVNADTVRLLAGQSAECLVLGAIPARDACEALLRVLLLKVPPQEFAPAVTAVVHSRLLRRLCDRCKEPYPAGPELLAQLGIPAGKVEMFYRPRQEKEGICETCRGIGYHGRVGIYELLHVTPAVRDVLVKSPQIDPLRKAAREAWLISARDQAILLVARGVTSLEEVQRVLKS